MLNVSNYCREQPFVGWTYQAMPAVQRAIVSDGRQSGSLAMSAVQFTVVENSGLTPSSTGIPNNLGHLL